MTKQPNPNNIVLDSKKSLRVRIEAKDQQGVFCSPTKCVGANAIRRLPGVLDVRVGARSARVLRSNGWHRYSLEPNTAAAVRAYDNAHQVMPIGFRFSLIPPRAKLQARVGTAPGTNKRSGQHASVASRQPSTRSLFVEPTSPNIIP